MLDHTHADKCRTRLIAQEKELAKLKEEMKIS